MNVQGWAKRVWNAAKVDVLFNASCSGRTGEAWKFTISLVEDGSEENPKRLSVNMTAKEARELGMQLVKMADEHGDPQL